MCQKMQHTSPSFYTPDNTNESGVVCCCVCPPDLLSIDELVSHMGDKLFYCITSDEHHVLHLIVLTVDTYSDHEETNSVSHPNAG